MPETAGETADGTAARLDDMRAWRHDFHRHPETGFDVQRTAGLVAERLERAGLEVVRGIGGSGVVGVLQRGNGHRSIGLRADMDALPIHELNTFAHRSRHDGAMHACGHDGHTAMLLGAACQLAESDRIDGRVVFIFQPNEEHGEGAEAMLADGLFERFDVDEVYGMHNIPGMPVGSFATRAGPITASESLFEIAVQTRGGHAALPHMGVDAIVVGTEIVGALQSIVSRKLDPAENGVVSVTEFSTDGARNVLPGRALLKGDARALTPSVTARIEACMRQIVDGVCAAHDVSAEVRFETIFPATINDPDAVAAVSRAARASAGDAATDSACPPKLFSEDFAHLAAARPGCFVLTGNGMDGPHARALHSADYDFNDEVLVPGSAFWVELVEQRLRGGSDTR